MSLCRPGREGDPVTCSGAGSQPCVGSRLTGTTLLVLEACLVLSCLIPLVLQTFRTIIKATAHVMPWKYKPQDEDVAL
jgi:hypothetical protein